MSGKELFLKGEATIDHLREKILFFLAFPEINRPLKYIISYRILHLKLSSSML